MEYRLGSTLRTFLKSRENIERKYPNSKEDIDRGIREILANPDRGDKIPGFRGKVIKMRMPLKKYKMGTRKGLRLIFLKEKKGITPLLIYPETDYPGEDWVVGKVKEALNDLVQDRHQD